MNGRQIQIPFVVVVTLAIVTISGLASMVYLAACGTAIPDQIDRLTVGASSALAAILATTRAGDEPPTPVVGADGGPVITEDVKKK